MANIKSQIKRNKQNEKRRSRNVQVKSSIRTASKKILKAIDAKQEPDKIKELFTEFTSTMDKAAQVRVVHKSTASRKKSRIAKRVNNALKAKS